MHEDISHHLTFCLKHTPIAPQELQDLWSLLHHQKVKTKIKKGNKPLLPKSQLDFLWQTGLQNILFI